MAESFITLNNGLVSLVDYEDMELLSQFNWRQHTGGYAIAKYLGKNMYMHRLICATPPNSETDHINNDKLDNRRCNLRLATVSQNRANVGRRSHNRSSKFKGVRLDRRNTLGHYHARTTINGKHVYLGTYHDEVSAARAYNDWAIQHFGDFAYLNPI